MELNLGQSPKIHFGFNQLNCRFTASLVKCSKHRENRDGNRNK